MKNTTLKPAHFNAIKLLSLGTPAVEVAEKLHITTMTLYRWQKNPEFESVLRNTSFSGLEEIAKKMNVTTITAIETLQEFLCNMGESNNVRLKAALGVLGAMASVNNALDKSLKHRAADFSREYYVDHFNTTTYDSAGEPCQRHLLPSDSVKINDDGTYTI